MKSPLKKSMGFALIEALVALAVVSLGSMGLAGVQMFLARNGDLAVQRTQATVIADSCLEALRAYALPEDWAGLPDRPKDASGVSVCPAGPTTIAPVGSNTSYTRQVFVGAAVSDNLKPVTVKVSWQDRAGETHSLDFTTVIAKSDPADAGRTVVAQASVPLFRNPNDRNIHIPARATDLLNGTSSLLIGVDRIIFDNETGMVVQVCTPTKCVTRKDFYVDGYITQADILPQCGILELDCLAYLLKHLSEILIPSVEGPGINGKSIEVKNPKSGFDIQCRFTRDATGLVALVAQILSALTGENKSYYYACNIPYVDVSPAEQGYWGGRILVGFKPERLPLTPVNYLVCRYQYTNVVAPVGLSSTVAEEYVRNKSNVQPYRKVRSILTDQNYLVYTGMKRDIPATCPVLKPPAGLPATAELKDHQRCVDGNRPETDCPGF